MSHLAAPLDDVPDAWTHVSPTLAEIGALTPRMDPGAWARLAARLLAGEPLSFGERVQLIGEAQRARLAELERGSRVARAD